MNYLRACLIFTVTTLAASHAFATTWSAIEVDDPIVQGEKCSVQEPSSYGSYVYQAASKYDQVFWPLTEANGIWYCAGSGFTAFIGDFSNLQVAEIERIKQYLLDNPPQTQSIESKLKRLEDIYRLRDADAILKNKLERVLARWYQDLNQIDKANAYRQLAFQGIEQNLTGKLLEPQRLEYLYVAANYSRQLGNAELSDQYLAKLAVELDAVENAELHGFRDYLKSLVLQTKYIKAGGVLDPVVPE